MAAPTPTTRGTPSGAFLPDGYQALLTFASLPTASFWEKTVQPPGIDGGEPIDTTTMQNTEWRTMFPRSLKTLTPFTVKAAYDPLFFAGIQMLSLVNRRNDTVTVRWGDGSTLACFAYLQKMDPDPLEEGKQPEITLTIVPTNYDYANKVVASPVQTNVAGT